MVRIFCRLQKLFFFFNFRVSNIEKRLNFSIVNNASRLTFQFLFGYHSRSLTSNKTTKKIHLNAYFYYDLYTKVTNSWKCVTDSLFWRIKSKSLFYKKSDNKLYYMQYHFANFLCISYNFSKRIMVSNISKIARILDIFDFCRISYGCYCPI